LEHRKAISSSVRMLTGKMTILCALSGKPNSTAFAANARRVGVGVAVSVCVQPRVASAVCFSAFPEHKDHWKAFYGVQLTPDKFLYMMRYVTGLYLDTTDTGAFTRIRLEFRGLGGDIVEVTYGKKFIAETSLFNLKKLIEPGWMLDEEFREPWRWRNGSTVWSYEAASKYGLMETVHFWSTFGAGGSVQIKP
jgi:hypothetical protein